MKLYLHKNVRMKVTRIQFSVGTTARNSQLFRGEFHALCALGTEASRESTIKAGEASEKETGEVPLSHFSRKSSMWNLKNSKRTSK